jgi:hypothetical protein
VFEEADGFQSVSLLGWGNISNRIFGQSPLPFQWTVEQAIDDFCCFVSPLEMILSPN